MMKKKILAALLASAMVLSIAGCNQETNGGNSENDTQGGNEGGAETTSGESGGSEAVDNPLTILAWESNSDIKNMVKIFCDETGTDPSQIVISPQGANGEGGRDQYQQYLKGDGDADLMCLEADWILQYINDDTLTAPLSDIGIDESKLNGPYSYTVAIGKNDAGVLKGASFQAAPGGFAYRADLAEQYLGVTSPDEMQALISDWDKFQAAAKTLYDASEGKTSMTATEGGLWQVFQANRTQPWVVDGKLVMDTAPDFYEIAKSFKDNGYLAGVPQWDAAWYAAIQDGTALGDFVPTWGMTNADGSILYNFTGGPDGKVAGQMAFCEGPTNYYWGGTWLGVSTKCNNKELAQQFVEFFTCDSDGMKAYSLGTGDFCNSKEVMKSIVDEKSNSNALLKDGQDQFAIFLGAADGINLDGLITKYDSVIKGHFNDSVNGLLDGTYADAAAAEVGFKQNVKASFPEIEVE
ncbi:MAG: ABC transporter substrate-binding protein [Bacteroides sp.]|nr:ABC transporter substrate-binding protein [Bacteroides sp.]